jgi:hypothetical protein
MDVNYSLLRTLPYKLLVSKESIAEVGKVNYIL